MKCDACDYDRSCYKHMDILIIMKNVRYKNFYNENVFVNNHNDISFEDTQTDLNKLYDAMNDSLNISKWKQSTQKYIYEYLKNLYSVQNRIESGSYKTGEKSKRIINERGKPRFIKGNGIDDKVVRKNFCENILEPIVERYLIYDNGASRKNKGVSFARDRLIVHLHKYYRKYYTNIGYILLCDISKYYDNIRHDIVIEQFSKIVNDGSSMRMIEEMISSMKIDVSYMNDEEYSKCMNVKFDSVEYAKLIKENGNKCLRKEKFMHKSVDIGDYISQIIGEIYLSKLDNYIKIVKGIKYYGRYMDDFYIICKDKEELKQLLKEIKIILQSLGLELNEKKTNICRIDKQFHYLQDSYRLTPAGKVFEKINKKKLTKERQRLKVFRNKLNNNEMEYKDIYNCFIGWLCSYTKHRKKRTNKNKRPTRNRDVLTRYQKYNLISLFIDLFKEEILMDELHKFKLKDGTEFEAYLNGNNYLPTTEVKEETLTDENLSEFYIDGVKYENNTCCNNFIEDMKQHIIFRQYTKEELATIQMKKMLAKMGITF